MVRPVDRKTRSRGQVLTEFALLAPLFLLLLFGVSELGYDLYQFQLITTLAREGANLIARSTSFHDADLALHALASGPASLGANGDAILSVVKLGTGGANKNVPIIAQRHHIGSLGTSSVFGEPPAGTYDGPPDFRAKDLDGNTNIQIPQPLPKGLILQQGQSVYVVEVVVRRASLVPFGRLGITLPTNISASAFF